MRCDRYLFVTYMGLTRCSGRTIVVLPARGRSLGKAKTMEITHALAAKINRLSTPWNEAAGIVEAMTVTRERYEQGNIDLETAAQALKHDAADLLKIATAIEDAAMSLADESAAAVTAQENAGISPADMDAIERNDL